MTRSTTKNSTAAGKAQAPKAGSGSSAAQQPAPAPVVEQEPAPVVVEPEPAPVTDVDLEPTPQFHRRTTKIRSVTERLRRGGIEFTRDGVDIDPADLTREQMVAILNEPLLTIDVRDELGAALDAELLGD